MNVIIHDRNGNRLNIPPTLPRLDISQREFQRRKLVATIATARLIATNRAALAFLDRLPQSETRP